MKGHVLVLTVLAVAAFVPAATASTPIPTKADGSGNETTAGGGIDAGKPFSARSADAVLDISFNEVEIFLFTQPVACSDIPFASPPFIQITLDSDGKPLIVGAPSVQNGKAFVQADFHPSAGTTYYAIQPGVSLTLTRVDPTKSGLWHGKLTVEHQQFEGKTFSYDGTFAARWCGKD